MNDITLNTPKPICECLAAWIDTADCVCGEPSGTPMPLDAEALRRANDILLKIKRLDSFQNVIQNDTELEAVGVQLKISRRHRSDDWIDLSIPPEFAKAIVFYARAQRYDELRRTGIVSADNTAVRQIIR